MNYGRTALFVVHVVGLALGGLLAVGATLSALEAATSHSLAIVLSKVILAAFLVVVTLTFAATLVLRGFTPAAPLLYFLGCVPGAIVVGANAHAMAKGFAPFDPQLLDYVVATGVIVLAFVIAAGAAMTTLRWSRFPLT